jgi:O-antigen ligase
MVTFLPAAIVVAMSPRHSVGKRGLAAVMAALMLATIVFTKSRGGMMGVVAAIAAIAVLGGSVRKGIGTMTVIAVLVAVPFVPSSVWDRMSTIMDEAGDKQFTGSREARQHAMEDGINAFLTFPFSGVGAGQFKNYNPPERQTRWLETHNVLIQVASETGLAGLLAFLFLIARAAMAAWTTRQTVRNRTWLGVMKKARAEDAARALGEHTLGMTAGLAGWFVCAMFASVAYNWTFYYVLALLVAGRELAFDQGRVAVPAKLKKISVGHPQLSTQAAR